MKMQMWKILILAAIHNETISLQMKFIHEALHGGIQVGEEGSILGIKLSQRRDFALGHDQHVKLIAGRRMMKRKQVRGLAQTRGRDEEAHVGENPSDPSNDNRYLKQTFHEKSIECF